MSLIPREITEMELPIRLDTDPPSQEQATRNPRLIPANFPDEGTWRTIFQETCRKTRMVLRGQMIEVSTVPLMIDHQWGSGPPLLWETMIFGPDGGDPQWRYNTMAAAHHGHDTLVAALLAIGAESGAAR
jgi:hypothetical protein